MHDLVLDQAGIDCGDAEHDHERPRQQAEQRDRRARRAAQVSADQDGLLDAVRARQCLVEGKGGEKGPVVEPAPAQHEFPVQPRRSAAAEAGAAEP